MFIGSCLQYTEEILNSVVPTLTAFSCLKCLPTNANHISILLEFLHRTHHRSNGASSSPTVICHVVCSRRQRSRYAPIHSFNANFLFHFSIKQLFIDTSCTIYILWKVVIFLARKPNENSKGLFVNVFGYSHIKWLQMNYTAAHSSPSPPQ